MNVEIGTETLIFFFWEYLFPIFGILSLQCSHWVSMYLLTCRGMTSALLTLLRTFLMEDSSHPPRHCFCPPGETLSSLLSAGGVKI